MKKTMHHERYIARTKRMSDVELEFSRRDAYQALEAFPEGINAGYYADEVSYLSMEIHRRKNHERP